MARKMVGRPFQVVTSGDMSSDITGEETTVTFTDNVGFQVVWIGTPTGTFSVEGTIDGITWTALDVRDADGNPPNAAGAAGSLLININQLPYDKVRLKYDATSGSGTLQAYNMTKSVGA